ncbi:MAG: tetratricopeptide repeat protein [Bacteroidetes bacterium]|nr:tetratricopeptide repeat protein [Bacteroidota bacterium]
MKYKSVMQAKVNNQKPKGYFYFTTVTSIMRKRLSISLLLLLISVGAFAQVDYVKKMKQELAAHPRQDNERVDILNELGSFFLSTPEKEKYATEALVIANKTGYTLGKGMALASLSRMSFGLGNRAKSDSLLQQAGSINKAINNKELAAYILYSKVVNTSTFQDSLPKLVEAADAFSKINNKRMLAVCYLIISNIYQTFLSDYPKAMEYGMKALEAAEGYNDLGYLIRVWNGLGSLYISLGDYENGLLYLGKASRANKEYGNTFNESNIQNGMGECYRLTGKYPEAIQAYTEAIKQTTFLASISTNESNLADVYTRLNNLPLAFQYAFSSLAKQYAIGRNDNTPWIFGILSRAYLKKQMPDSALYYGRLGLDTAIMQGTIEFMRDNALALADAYAYKKNFEQAYDYHLRYINYRDSMLGGEVRNKTAVIKYKSDLQGKQLQIASLSQQKKSQQNFLIAALVVLFLIMFTAAALWRNNRLKQKAKKKIEKAYRQLQSTQAQLVQSEKMASLGELTAGIAHEIQNPLNFVNNFSEVNNELIKELKSEVIKGNLDEVSALADDIESNSEKINHHGKRADAIVKGMLQHSRTSSAVKEPTNINTLADEYLRLSYHGLRARDKSFNATTKTNFDNSIGKIDLIPQEIGRVLINLYNNAFYAVSEKQKQNIRGYDPVVTVSTKKINDTIEIKVEDNGNGIPGSIKEKIFQPFFTTKPTGQGTGLGLSLSYDIVKTHGGELKVETKEGEGTTFIIQLPIS